MNAILSTIFRPVEARLTGSVERFVHFFHETHPTFFAYVYHRTGSLETALSITNDTYIALLSRTLSLWWFGSTDIASLLRSAEPFIVAQSNAREADIDTVYLPALRSLNDDAKTSLATLHDALWSLQSSEQTVLILSLLVGLDANHLAQALNTSKEAILLKVEQATKNLIERWKPSEEVRSHLSDIAFTPTLHTNDRVNLENAIELKANQLRWRTMQWVMVGSLFAVMSNVIVASVLAFAVILTPATSLKSTQQQLAVLDGFVLERQRALGNVQSVLSEERMAEKRTDATIAARGLTKVGLSTAIDTLREEQKREKGMNTIIRTLDRGLAFVRSIVVWMVRMWM